MKTFFVEQSNKVEGVHIFLKKVTKKGKKIIINSKLEKINKKDKIAKKIKNILMEEKSKQIVLSENLKKDDEFMKILYGYNINICDSKWLFKQLTNEIIKKIMKNGKKEDSEIHICINELDEISEKYINQFAKEFKRINIITNHIGKFRKIENKLFDEDGILINITNNKRKSLSKAKLILNIDFPKELINEFVICSTAKIITWEDNIKILSKNFNGKIINDCDYIITEENEITEFIRDNNLMGYDEKDICQALEIVPNGNLII